MIYWIIFCRLERSLVLQAKILSKFYAQMHYRVFGLGFFVFNAVITFFCVFLPAADAHANTAIGVILVVANSTPYLILVYYLYL